jgi:Chaperone for flagella basal body P-ring formation
MRRRAGLMVSLLLLCVGAGFAQKTMPGLQSRLAQVVARDLGWELQESATPLRVKVLAPGLRLPDEVRLHVAAVHASGVADSWLLRMECSTRVECLPFEVVLQSSGHQNPSVEAASVHSAAGAEGPLPPQVVRAGQRVRLAEEISGMRLSALAICLQPGGVGQRIRVRNLSSGRVVPARVRAGGELEAEE